MTNRAHSKISLGRTAIPRIGCNDRCSSWPPHLGQSEEQCEGLGAQHASCLSCILRWKLKYSKMQIPTALKRELPTWRQPHVLNSAIGLLQTHKDNQPMWVYLCRGNKERALADDSPVNEVAQGNFGSFRGGGWRDAAAGSPPGQDCGQYIYMLLCPCDQPGILDDSVVQRGYSSLNHRILPQLSVCDCWCLSCIAFYGQASPAQS